MCSSNVAVRVEGVGKCYQIYSSPRERLKQFVFPKLRRLVGKPVRQYFREFWALREINFQIQKGDTVGIIGRNGSGKSTLLQLICGTVTPTTGRIEVNGKVAALLELGAGFNPEFTGRENVFMAAALYGLTQQTIEERYQRILDFADIGDFIDQPVKTYSSGMYVRLAFAVIAHVDAEILVVDEALAVGDAIFTQKCMRFIREFQKQGTLIFVSHDTASVINLCKRAIWLDAGEVRQIGESQPVTESYLQYTLQQTYGNDVSLNSVRSEKGDTAECSEVQSGVADIAPYSEPIVDYEGRVTTINNLSEANGWKTGSAEIIDVQFRKATPDGSLVFQGGERVELTIQARANESLANPILGFLIRDRLGQALFGENSLPFTRGKSTPVRAGDEFVARFVFRLPMLPNGHYTLMASVADGDLHHNVQHHWLHDALLINVSSSKIRWGLVGIPFEDVKLTVKS